MLEVERVVAIPCRARDGAKNARKRPIGVGVLERLEGRELLTVSPLIGPGPDLTVSGFAAPVATYGGPLTVVVNVANIAHPNEVDNPLAALPDQPSVLPDSGPTYVSVYASSTRKFNVNREVLLDLIAIPALAAGSSTVQSTTLTLPSTPPKGLPKQGHRIYLTFQVAQADDTDSSNNGTTIGVPVLLSPPLPDLRAIAFQTPPTMQPGDVIDPSIKIGNYGTIDSSLQAPIEVNLVASPTAKLSKDAHVIAMYNIDSLTPLSEAPTTNLVVGDANLSNPPNVTTLFGVPVMLPSSPRTYFIGLIVDPNRKIRQIRDLVSGPIRPFTLVRKVGPPIAGLPPAGIVSQPAPPANLFPTPPFGPINQTTA